MAARAVIFGCRGADLAAEERRFFAAADPWGFILFARNVETPDQLRRLTADLREAVGRDAPVLIDQEGGRVARLAAGAPLLWARQGRRWGHPIRTVRRFGQPRRPALSMGSERETQQMFTRDQSDASWCAPWYQRPSSQAETYWF